MVSSLASSCAIRIWFDEMYGVVSKPLIFEEGLGNEALFGTWRNVVARLAKIQRNARPCAAQPTNLPPQYMHLSSAARSTWAREGA